MWYSIRTRQKWSFFLRGFFRMEPAATRDFTSFRRCFAMRTRITLACSECKQRNYNTMKNKKNDPDRIEMNKYCRFCKKHTLHKETK